MYRSRLKASEVIMQGHTHTERHGINLMPWQIEAAGELEKSCILVATMNGNEMLSVSLHVASSPPVSNPDCG